MTPRDVIAGIIWSEAAANTIIDHLWRHGYAIVPRVATEAMQLAGHDVRSDPATGMPTGRATDEIWAAMIAAAENA